MPDFFLGKPLSHSDYPPDTEEKQKTVGAFFGGPAKPDDNAKKVPELVKEIEKQCSGIKKWGSLGFCWGGKVDLASFLEIEQQEANIPLDCVSHSSTGYHLQCCCRVPSCHGYVSLSMTLPL